MKMAYGYLKNLMSGCYHKKSWITKNGITKGKGANPTHGPFSFGSRGSIIERLKKRVETDKKLGKKVSALLENARKS